MYFLKVFLCCTVGAVGLDWLLDLEETSPERIQLDGEVLAVSAHPSLNMVCCGCDHLGMFDCKRET